MPYIEDICNPLVKVLRHTAGLPAHQLAGHAANIEFWVAEAVHRLAVIDGYHRRFDALKSAQEAYQREHGVIPDAMPLTRSTQDQDRKELRREVVESAARLLSRCVEIGVLGELRAGQLRDRLSGGPVRTA
jgi:hypothetical protein